MATKDRNEPLTASKAGEQWKIVGVRHHHGINVPLFALHSKESAGIGEFLDLCPLIQWCSSIGLDIVQLLPLNDSGPDRSPYNALSAFALNPIYISLSKLPHIEKHSFLKKKLKELQALTPKNPIPYEQIHILKREFLHYYWEKEFQEISSTHTYQDFINNNPWTREYSLFKVLKDIYNGAYWKEWPEESQNPSSEYFEDLCTSYQVECSFYKFLQYLCYIQLKYVKEYGISQRVFLMGDLPILISPDSADVWAHRELFIDTLSAGAPPDMYSEEGQSWGFPLYKWSAFEANHYVWWKDRMHTAASFYHIFRIDHVVGFFRIWAIPKDKKSKEGHYEPEDKALWIPQGKRIMECMLESSEMLPIGEDLGVVPTEVRTTLRELGICGTKVLRWERVWEEDARFVPTNEYIPESLSTVSTHDSDTLVLWWKNTPEEAQAFCKTKNWTYAPEITHDQIKEILHDSHHSSSLFHVNLLQEYFSLFKELSYDNPEDERINLPGVINEKNWCYRFRPSLEEIISHKDLKKTLCALIK